MQSFKELVENIKRPFLFLKELDASKIATVKDIEERTMSLALKALEASSDTRQKGILKNLISTFSGYSRLTIESKSDVIRKAFALLSLLEEGPPAQQGETRLFNPALHSCVDRVMYESSEERLSDSVQYLKGVGPKIAEKFASAGIYSVGDLLFFFPHRYEDRRRMLKIGELAAGENATFIADVKDLHVVYFRGMRRAVLDLKLEDETGRINAKWFNFKRAYFEGKIKIGDKAVFSGKIQDFRGKREIHHPEFEVLGKTGIDPLSFSRVVPIYSEVGGLYQKTLRKIMARASMLHAKERLCHLPPHVCEKFDLLSPSEALLEIHSPSKFAEEFLRADRDFIQSAPYKSLIFQELFIFNLMIGLKKRTIKTKTGYQMKVDEKTFGSFLSKIPFTLTGSQAESLSQIRRDMALERPMNRLLEGDVGSGKTVVALLSALIAAKSGYQTAFMAPTEILAGQIYKEATKVCEKAQVRCAILIGGQDGRTRGEVYKGLSDGSIELVVGTHALIQEEVKMKRLGLIIVDEQHRFGVLQRSAIREKGEFPHVLVMSATPIPRTLALTYYGDLDISTITELPKGRQPITTKLVNDQARSKLYDFVKKEIKGGRQAYIIYPIIEESKKIDLLDATRMAKYLSETVFSGLRCGLIHGRLPSDEKDRVMTDFRGGKIDILFSTTVIEVGIDVPNATIMIVEHPERFGLSQLHQLRGRVGRGAFKSYCFLLLGVDYEGEIKERLKIFRDTQDGFKLAEEDLKIRGPGDFFGVSQSGLPPFRIAQFPRDLELLKISREASLELLNLDYHLSEAKNRILPLIIKKYWGNKLNLLQIG